jgi:hypothetical protein
MSALHDALVGLAPAHDAEMVEGYRRYEALLETLLTPEQLDTYAAYIRQAGALRVFEEMAPEELEALTTAENVIAMSIIADQTASMENRRVAALLTQREHSDVAPDLANRQDEAASAA